MNKKDQPVLAIFDFDGTITHSDSFKDFLLFSFKLTKFLIVCFTKIPILLAYVTGTVSNGVAKENIFSAFFKNMSKKEFNLRSHEYSKKRLPSILQEGAISRIGWHKNQDHEVIILSASCSDWILPWAVGIGIKTVIGTEPEIINDRLTGVFSTKNCYGAEKVVRLKKSFPDLDKYCIYVYSDSMSDRHLFQLADSAFYRSFDTQLKK